MKTWTENGINYVSYVWNNIEQEILNKKVREINGNEHTIQVTDTGNGIDEPIQMGVNWAACGAVPAAESLAFAKRITEIAELASNYRYNGYVLGFKGGCTWDSISEEEKAELKNYAHENGI